MPHQLFVPHIWDVLSLEPMLEAQIDMQQEICAEFVPYSWWSAAVVHFDSQAMVPSWPIESSAQGRCSCLSTRIIKLHQTYCRYKTNSPTAL